MSLSWPLENKVSLFCNCVEYLVRSSFLGAGGERFESRAFSSQRIWRRDTFVWRTNGSGAVESRNGARPIDTWITNSVNSAAAIAAIRGAGRRGFTEWMTGVSRAVWRLMEESVDLRNRLLDGWSQEAITLDPGVAANGDAFIWTKQLWIKTKQDGNYFWSPAKVCPNGTPDYFRPAYDCCKGR